MISVAYAPPETTLAITVIRQCSLTLKGPGFNVKRYLYVHWPPRGGRFGNVILKLRVVNIRSQTLPAGSANSCATRAVIWTLGYRIEKNWFKPDISTVNNRPRSHLWRVRIEIAQSNEMADIRKVFVGIDTSSVFATAARTSGYGESSSMSL